MRLSSNWFLIGALAVGALAAVFGVNKYLQRRKQDEMVKAIMQDNSFAINALLAKGIDPNIALTASIVNTETNGVLYSYTMTPLAVAAMSGKLDAVKALIAGGADPNLKFEIGELPITYAAQGGHTEIVDYLIQNGGAAPK